MEPTNQFESELRRRGFRCIAGVDEAGRGPLAGPVVAAAVVLPFRCSITGLNDSKLLTAEARETLFRVIVDKAVTIGIGHATAAEIDAVNILEATRLAMRRALADCRVNPDFLLLDAVSIPNLRLPQRAIIKGDQLSVSVAAASVIAKVVRDEEMARVHEHYPHYNFPAHKGYGTPEHLRMLEAYGPSPVHRRSFDPVRRVQQRAVYSETPAVAMR